MCVYSAICRSNQKDFFLFLFAFESDLYHSCFFKVFQVVFVWKTCILGVFASKAYPRKISRVKLSHEVYTESFATKIFRK